MTSAALVNMVISKLRTGTVEFLEISNRTPPCVSFVYASIKYTIWCDALGIEVHRHLEDGDGCVCDSYQIWMEGVLNGRVRTESGELVSR